MPEDDTINVALPIGWLKPHLDGLMSERQEAVVHAAKRALKKTLDDPTYMTALVESAARRAIEEHVKFIVNRAISDTVYHDAEGASAIERTALESIMRVVRTKLESLV